MANIGAGGKFRAALIHDADGDFARNYDVSDTSVLVIRPDGYLGIAARGVVDDELVRHLKATFR